MCVGFWTLSHPDFALILCSNRDEYLARPTAPAQWHSFGPISTDDNTELGSVLSGRDFLAGGTWAGITRDGRIALLTNITEPIRKYSSSRGDLTHSYLLRKAPQPTFEAEIDAFLDRHRGRAYAGFNLLLLAPSSSSPGDLGPHALSFDGAFLTNSGGGGTISARMLTDDERRCGGMSNGVDHQGAREWPKVEHGTRALHGILNALPQDATEPEIAEQLFALLTWKSEHTPADRSELRNTIQVEPISIQLPSLPAAADKRTPTPGYYGTRLSTVILIRRDGSVTFIERDMWTLDESGRPCKRDSGHDRVFHFGIQPGDSVDAKNK